MWLVFVTEEYYLSFHTDIMKPKSMILRMNVLVCATMGPNLKILSAFDRRLLE